MGRIRWPVQLGFTKWDTHAEQRGAKVITTGQRRTGP